MIKQIDAKIAQKGCFRMGLNQFIRKHQILYREKTASRKRDFTCLDAIARLIGGSLMIVLSTDEKALWLQRVLLSKRRS